MLCGRSWPRSADSTTPTSEDAEITYTVYRVAARYDSASKHAVELLDDQASDAFNKEKEVAPLAGVVVLVVVLVGVVVAFVALDVVANAVVRFDHSPQVTLLVSACQYTHTG
jgi:hypothetical protein